MERIRATALAPLCAAISGIVLFLPAAAAARTTIQDYSIENALNSRTGEEKLLDIDLFFARQPHPAVVADLGVFKANRRTNAFGKSDENACRIAFLSALISLQERAVREGGNAVVNIKSITKHQDLVSATQFRCAAGNVVANVALTGRVVRLEE